MGFFSKKKPEPKKPKPRSLQECVQERVLTAEGWRRRMIRKVKKGK
jgi:hypothetical protein